MNAKMVGKTCRMCDCKYCTCNDATSKQRTIAKRTAKRRERRGWKMDIRAGLV